MKKVLFVTYDFPYPTNSGGKSRAYNLIKFSKSANLDFFLFSFTREHFKKSYEEELKKIGVSKIFTAPRKNVHDPLSWGKAILGKSSIFKLLYFDKEVEKKLLEVIKNEKIDLVLFESFYTSFYISDKIRKLGVKQIFGTENIEHILYYDFAKEKPKFLQKPFVMQVSRVRREEEKAFELADFILSVTKEEKKYIEKISRTPVSIIPNGVNTKTFSFKEKKTFEKSLLFVGNFSYFPNVDAMEFFYKDVFLKIQDTKLTLIGKHQDKLEFLRKDSRIKQIDYIEDVREEYYNADIFIFPVRFGGGTNFKILEAAACGTPIIAIPDRVNGLGFEENKHYIPAKNSREFISGIESLLEKRLREKVSKNARTLVEEEYSWENIGDKLRELLKNL